MDDAIECHGCSVPMHRQWFPTDTPMCWNCVEDLEFKKADKRCNWCDCLLSTKRCEFNKWYCKDCEADCVRECTKCHRPFPTLSKFNQSETECDSCFKKKQKAKLKSKGNEF